MQGAGPGQEKAQRSEATRQTCHAGKGCCPGTAGRGTTDRLFPPIPNAAQMPTATMQHLQRPRDAEAVSW